MMKVFAAAISKSKGEKVPISVVLSVDTESKFSNTVQLQEDSYPLHFYAGAVKLLDDLKELGINAVFFVNYPEVQIFRNHQNSPVVLLKRIASEKHQIGLHIHPAQINPEKSPDLSFYSSERIGEMVREGKKVLEDAAGCEIVAFRAGGYSIGRWEAIYEQLLQIGIKIDSSVFPGASNLHLAKFDFTKATIIDRCYYPKSNDVLTECESGPIKEYPITTVLPVSNSSDAFFFSFNPSIIMSKWLLRLYYFSLIKKNPNAIINILYHSKHVFDESGKLRSDYSNLLNFIRFLLSKSAKFKTYE